MKKTLFIITVFAIIVIIISLFIINKLSFIQSSSTSESESEGSIPRISIIGNIDNMQEKSDKRKVKIMYESDDVCFESYAKMKIQGAYTLRFDKKNYNITFYNDEDCTEKQKFDVKWGEYSKYTLKANWTDPLCCRNIVTAQVASEINKKYGILSDTVNNGLTDGFPIEIYNNGNFLGLYTMNIHKDYLFNMDKNNENHIVIMARDPYGIAFVKPVTDEWQYYELEVGEQNSETLSKLNRLIDFILRSTDDEFKNNFSDYFNLDSVLNYYILMKFANLVDNVTRNIFLVTFDGEHWYMIPYDFDQSWGNEYKEKSLISDSGILDVNSLIKMTPLWKKFKRLFKDEISERYSELRSDILTKDNVVNKMNNFYSLIPNKTFKLEHSRWNNEADYDRTYINDYLDDLILKLDREIGL